MAWKQSNPGCCCEEDDTQYPACPCDIEPDTLYLTVAGYTPMTLTRGSGYFCGSSPASTNWYGPTIWDEGGAQLTGFAFTCNETTHQYELYRCQRTPDTDARIGVFLPGDPSTCIPFYMESTTTIGLAVVSE